MGKGKEVIIMCLDKLADFKISKYEGWQVFTGDEKGLYPWYRSLEYHKAMKRTTIPMGEWQEDKNNYLILANDSRTYQTGFHIFLRKKDAETWVEGSPSHFPIRKVKFKKVVAKGFQDGRKVVVARERFVCES